MILSNNFTLEEATFSSTATRLGIDNSCEDEAIIDRAKNTAKMMEIIRHILGDIPIHIDSWIRCLELNRVLGSKDTSQHILGEAVDFICPTFGTPIQIAKIIIDNVAIIDFDQLIYEHTWIHISKKFSGPNRRNILTLMPSGSYQEGIIPRI